MTKAELTARWVSLNGALILAERTKAYRDGEQWAVSSVIALRREVVAALKAASEAPEETAGHGYVAMPLVRAGSRETINAVVATNGDIVATYPSMPIAVQEAKKLNDDLRPASGEITINGGDERVPLEEFIAENRYGMSPWDIDWLRELDVSQEFHCVGMTIRRVS